ncbi:MAG: phosphoglycerate kinase [Candidatus Scalindua sp. AMX11]|nr:MAG: phosphoglycerate kinase [Candidatus Scalindua sp.]NOG82221.1 phosphoglycerate kinase [Planctomycetota bacterium]RZV65503.1 MAG: phosphoglycerate kinase [Candidatus Scalindua sp. SCAELEC01]TDE63383.1 MAG: phosphoglycerate kinase [Candidatus Scalindua sp. AMX11]GJQ57259.1 MAG: phosphoglycerate kinase [Candidatus Scalindua sp.]
MTKLFIKDVDLRGKKVFVRVDYNVPLDEQGNITDDARIRATLPTLNYLLDEDAKIVLASHLGRPGGKVVPGLSVRPIAKRLNRLLDKNVKLAKDCIGPEVESQINNLKTGDVLLLENLRFHSEEEDNDPEFAKALVGSCDVFIQEAFGNCHRSHASMVSINGAVSQAAAGFLLKKEIDYFEKAVNNPLRPLVALVGGAKVVDKIKIIENLVKKVDKLIIGGAMAFPFLNVHGYGVGKSKIDETVIVKVMMINKLAKERGVKIYLPVDFVIADNFDKRAETKVATFQEIPDDWYALDIGPASTKLFSEAMQNAKTIIWNGPMGAFEMDAFSRGTYAMVESVVSAYALTIVGGGDTDLAFHRMGESYKVSFISTGGGAFLELLEGKELPGVATLTDKD